MLKVYLVQMDSSTEDKTNNFEKVRRLLHTAAPEQGSLILLPEMFATGYLPQQIDLAAEDFKTSASGPTAEFLSSIANETSCFVMGAGISLSPNNLNPTNHISVYAPGICSEFASYNKIHLFFPEKKSFTAGNEIKLFRIREWNIAPFICYDLRFPEIFRKAIKAGANLITVQASWPAQRRLHWETLLRARAIENQVYIAAVNSVASKESTTGNGAGTSLIFSPQGDILAKGSENTETVISANLDLNEEILYRKNFPVLDEILP